MKRVIITGPTGTIGVALADILTQGGCEVYAICRPSSANIKNLKKHPNLHIVECDISNLLSLKDKLTGPFDAFYHFAWNGTFGQARNEIDLQIKNVQYTLDAVNLAKSLDCEVLVGAGSQAEYGHFTAPANESTITKPFTLYGAAKLSAGQMSRVYARNLSMKHVWVRIFSVFGPCDDSRTLVSYVIDELIAGKCPALTLGEQIWDYLYSYDAAEAMIKVAQSGKDGAVYCLGSGEKRLLKEYIQDIASVVNPNVNLSFGQKPYGENQIIFLAADIKKLQEDTGFMPKVNFKSAIQEILLSRENESAPIKS